MNTSRCWVGLFVVMIFALGSGAAAADPWRVAEQPELKQALESAALLQTESLGEPSRGVVPYRDTWRALVPNLDGKTWDMLQWYYKEYHGPTWLYTWARAR
jgi:hypothetical protein